MVATIAETKKIAPDDLEVLFVHAVETTPKVTVVNIMSTYDRRDLDKTSTYEQIKEQREKQIKELKDEEEARKLRGGADSRRPIKQWPYRINEERYIATPPGSDDVLMDHSKPPPPYSEEPTLTTGTDIIIVHAVNRAGAQVTLTAPFRPGMYVQVRQGNDAESAIPSSYEFAHPVFKAWLENTLAFYACVPASTVRARPVMRETLGDFDVSVHRTIGVFKPKRLWWYATFPSEAARQTAARGLTPYYPRDYDGKKSMGVKRAFDPKHASRVFYARQKDEKGFGLPLSQRTGEPPDDFIVPDEDSTGSRTPRPFAVPDEVLERLPERPVQISLRVEEVRISPDLQARIPIKSAVALDRELLAALSGTVRRPHFVSTRADVCVELRDGIFGALIPQPEIARSEFPTFNLTYDIEQRSEIRQAFPSTERRGDFVSAVSFHLTVENDLGLFSSSSTDDEGLSSSAAAAAAAPSGKSADTTPTAVQFVVTVCDVTRPVQNTVTVQCADESWLLRYCVSLVSNHIRPDLVAGWNTYTFDDKVMFWRGYMNPATRTQVEYSAHVLGRRSTLLYKALKTGSRGDNILLRYFNTLVPAGTFDGYIGDSVHFGREREKGSGLDVVAAAMGFSGKLGGISYDDVSEAARPEGASEDLINCMLEYSLQDSRVTAAVIREQGLLPLYDAIAESTSVPHGDLQVCGQQQRYLHVLWKTCRRFGSVVDGIGQNRFARKGKYEGGYVFNPSGRVFTMRSGVVLLLDFEALYPSIMIEYNICYSTMIPSARVAKRLADCGVPINAVRVSKDCVIRCIGFNPEKPVGSAARGFQGMLPRTMVGIGAERDRFKREMKAAAKRGDESGRRVGNARQLAKKIDANSSYGSLGAGSGVLPLGDGAAAITAIGRRSILRCATMVEEMCEFCKVVYGDTDSIYVLVREALLTAMCFAYYMERILTKEFNQGTGKMRQETEGIFGVGYFIKPKTYVCIGFDAAGDGTVENLADDICNGLCMLACKGRKKKLKLKLNGLPAVRRDKSRVARFILKSVYNMVTWSMHRKTVSEMKRDYDAGITQARWKALGCDIADRLDDPEIRSMVPPPDDPKMARAAWAWTLPEEARTGLGEAIALLRRRAAEGDEDAGIAMEEYDWWYTRQGRCAGSERDSTEPATAVAAEDKQEGVLEFVARIADKVVYAETEEDDHIGTVEIKAPASYSEKTAEPPAAIMVCWDAERSIANSRHAFGTRVQYVVEAPSNMHGSYRRVLRDRLKPPPGASERERAFSKEPNMQTRNDNYGKCRGLRTWDKKQRSRDLKAYYTDTDARGEPKYRIDRADVFFEVYNPLRTFLPVFDSIIQDILRRAAEQVRIVDGLCDAAARVEDLVNAAEGPRPADDVLVREASLTYEKATTFEGVGLLKTLGIVPNAVVRLVGLMTKEDDMSRVWRDTRGPEGKRVLRRDVLDACGVVAPTVILERLQTRMGTTKDGDLRWSDRHPYLSTDYTREDGDDHDDIDEAIKRDAAAAARAAEDAKVASTGKRGGRSGDGGGSSSKPKKGKGAASGGGGRGRYQRSLGSMFAKL
jgi:uncharacterized membrane protein YgcG